MAGSESSTTDNSTEIGGMVDGRCYNPRAPLEGPPLFQNGDIKFQAHDVGWIVCAFFTIVACVTSFWLINKHLRWYTNKKEQRYIVRLLFMVPIYAVISLASFLFWNNSTPLLLIRDAYEAVLLTSFFYLLLTYLSPDPEEQKAILRKEGLSRQNDAERIRRGEQPKKWFFPFGFVKWKPADGLYFLQYMKWAVLQYCVVRPVTTLAAIVLNYIGLYCEESWSPAWGHIWITGIISLSVTVAMYCLVQFYLSVASYLVRHKPVLKMVSIKAVVFLTFWQASALSLLTMFDVVKDTPYMTAADINIGWGALLETFEMAIFAFVHVKAFTYKPYRPITPDAQRTPRLRALMHAMDFRETFRELRTGWIYMWRQMRGKETDVVARREAHLESAFGKSRADVWRGEKDKNKGGEVEMEMEIDVDVEGERQWLGVGDDYAYGLTRRERSEALGIQIERELESRGVTQRVADIHDKCDPTSDDTSVQRSWWRGLYDRVSQSNPDDDLPSPSLSKPKRHSKSKSRRPSQNQNQNQELKGLVYTYDDLPPPSPLQTYRSSRRASRDMARPPPIDGHLEGMPVLYGSIPEHDVQHAVSRRTRQPPPTRSDSLLGRVFPPSQPRTSDYGHTSTSEFDSSRSHLDQVKLPPPTTRFVGAGRTVEVTLPLPLGDVGPPPGKTQAGPAGLSPPLNGRAEFAHSPPLASNQAESAPSPPPANNPATSAQPSPPSLAIRTDGTNARRRSSHRRESATYQDGPRSSKSNRQQQRRLLVSPTYIPSTDRAQYSPPRGSPYGPAPSSPTRGPSSDLPGSPPPLYGSSPTQMRPIYAAAVMAPPSPSYSPPSRRQSGDGYRQPAGGAQGVSRSRRDR